MFIEAKLASEFAFSFIRHDSNRDVLSFNPRLSREQREVMSLATCTELHRAGEMAQWVMYLTPSMRVWIPNTHIKASGLSLSPQQWGLEEGEGRLAHPQSFVTSQSHSTDDFQVQRGTVARNKMESI